MNATSGEASATSGAATTISSSCCAMCAANSRSASSSSGDTSAAASASQPHANAATCPRAIPCPTPAFRHRRATPAPYATPTARTRLDANIVERHFHDRHRDREDEEQHGRQRAEQGHERRALVFGARAAVAIGAPPGDAGREDDDEGGAGDGLDRDRRVVVARP